MLFAEWIIIISLLLWGVGVGLWWGSMLFAERIIIKSLLSSGVCLSIISCAYSVGKAV